MTNLILKNTAESFKVFTTKIQKQVAFIYLFIFFLSFFLFSFRVDIPFSLREVASLTSQFCSSKIKHSIPQSKGYFSQSNAKANYYKVSYQALSDFIFFILIGNQSKTLRSLIFFNLFQKSNNSQSFIRYHMSIKWDKAFVTTIFALVCRPKISGQ